MKDDFYRKFEDKFRGSRNIIKKRLNVYLPFVLPFKEIYRSNMVLDIGCGRGEWIELMKENNINTIGIDYDKSMLEVCKRLELPVEYGDGIEFLKKQTDESIDVISSFHFIEHISFEELQIFIREAFRILKPGGILILETPNAENIKVATENFYMDPTHYKPIPSSLLAFLTEYYGFCRVKILKLQEIKKRFNVKNITLMDVFEGVSPDYAVIAQKKSSFEIMHMFDNVFSLEYGTSLSEVIRLFDERLRNAEIPFGLRNIYRLIKKYLKN